jgi:histidinol dehydrogenase
MQRALAVADEMIAGVRARGDAYVSEQIARFDNVSIAPADIAVALREVTIDDDMRDAIDTAIARIDAFHRPQLPQSYRIAVTPASSRQDAGVTYPNLAPASSRQDAGVTAGSLEHRVRPLRRVGVYVPGGRAVYLSTLIMCAVPARIAGVGEIVVITTPAASSRDELHYAARLLGVATIYQCGGAAGVAAAAIGTESLPRVDKIVGPGNSYVTAAKMRLIGEVGIDMTAGPTELVVIADDSADLAFVQADLDAQQEHGDDSVVTCIGIGKPLAVRATRNLVAQSREEAIRMANDIAPEHLSIQTRDARQLAELAENCGAIFCGPYSPVAAGDYVAGPNHVLPTAGSARFFSPLGVYDFVKRSNVIDLSAGELAEISAAGERIARFEGLTKHAESIAARRTACLDRS